MASDPLTFRARLTAPQPIERLALLRLLAPLAILGFLSSRMRFADHWIGRAGFRVPELIPAPYSQPLYLPGLPTGLAWGLVGVLLVSGLLTSAGLATRRANAVFAACLVYVAWADRLSAFSVNKLGAVMMVALCFTPAGARWSLDALRAARRPDALPPPTHVRWGNVRFFQALLAFIYCSSGIAKARSDWLVHDHVLWTHLHDSYQTAFSLWFANLVPAPAWTVAQWLVLGFEVFAPLLFWGRRSRLLALAFGLGMHAFIGLCFGPVVWFALLMAALLLAGFLPAAWLRALAYKKANPSQSST